MAKSMKLLLACCMVLYIVSVPVAHGWGKWGHMGIGLAASSRLTDQGRAFVKHWAGTETLEAISPLLDDYSHSSSGAWSKPLHYVDVPKTATSFTGQGSCTTTGCVLTALQQWYTNITSGDNDTIAALVKQRATNTRGYMPEPEPLVWLVHLLEDIHQPMHVAFGFDRGGNDCKLEFYGSKTNLHQLWDERMIDRWAGSSENAEAIAQAISDVVEQNPDLVQKYTSNMNFLSWGEESFEVTSTTAYMFDTDGSFSCPQGLSLGDDYYNKNLPLLEDRLLAATVRLAELLNTIAAHTTK